MGRLSQFQVCMYESLIVLWRHSKCIIKYIIITSCFVIRHAFSILSSSDTLIGISGNNRMNGQGGNDAMNGQGGNDAMNGQGGNDAINGRSGNDQMCLSLS
jgi:Ca2+-binding RTX toxin-like protein